MYIHSVYVYILCVDFLILNECIEFGFGVIKFIQQIPLRIFELFPVFSYYKLVLFKVLFHSEIRSFHQNANQYTVLLRKSFYKKKLSPELIVLLKVRLIYILTSDLLADK